MKSAFGQVLVIASTIDAEEEILPIAWGYIPTESEYWWKQFCKFLKECHKSLTNDDDISFISDRAKGLIPAVDAVFPHAWHYYCIQHLAENVKDHFGKKISDLFRQLPYCETRVAFDAGLQKIRELNEAAAKYILEIDPRRYARYCQPNARYGQYCSNISESLNSVWMEARELPVLQSINFIWLDIMKKFAERRRRIQENPRWTTTAWGYFLLQATEARKYLVVPSDERRLIALVSHPRAHDQHTVCLSTHKCTCLEFFDRQIPCRHAIAACKAFGRDPEEYINDLYSISWYRQTYKGIIGVIQLRDIQEDTATEVLPPEVPAKRGRPKKARIPKDRTSLRARQRARTTK